MGSGTIKDKISNVCGLIILLCTILAPAAQAEMIPKDWSKYLAVLAGGAGATIGYLTGKDGNAKPKPPDENEPI